jgi:hypothetical protein
MRKSGRCEPVLARLAMSIRRDEGPSSFGCLNHIDQNRFSQYRRTASLRCSGDWVDGCTRFPPSSVRVGMETSGLSLRHVFGICCSQGNPSRSVLSGDFSQELSGTPPFLGRLLSVLRNSDAIGVIVAHSRRAR